MIIFEKISLTHPQNFFCLKKTYELICQYLLSKSKNVNL